jgi:hypothetical protein
VSLEDDLRTVLRDRAAEPATQRNLLDMVHTGVRRDRRRRTALVGGAAALTLVAVVAGPTLLADRSSRPPQPPTASVVPTTPAVAQWDQPDWKQPTFPLVPGWLPKGAGRPEVLQLGANVLLEYEWPGSVLDVEVGPVAGSWGAEEEEEHPGTVNGRSATVRTSSDTDPGTPGDHRYVGVRWRLADGRWVQVASFGPRSEAQVLRFARELRPGSVAAAAAPFTFAEVPPGLTLQHQNREAMCLVPRGQPLETDDESAESRLQPRGLCLHLSKEPFTSEDAQETLSVAGRRAAYSPDGLRFVLDLGAGWILDVSWNDETPLTRADVIRLVSGIRVTYP